MANPQHEPTMEEILASIRKIISDDATSSPATPAAAEPEHAAEPEVLDLTHEIAEPAAAPAIAAVATDARLEESHSESHGEPAVEPIAEPAAEIANPAQIEAEASPAPEEGLFSDKARQALSDALEGMGHEAPEPPVAAHVETHAVTAMGIAGLSVESVFERAVKESFDPVLQKWLAENHAALVEHMKPVIRDWLDENFPALLEDAIRSELARAAKPRSRR